MSDGESAYGAEGSAPADTAESVDDGSDREGRYSLIRRSVRTALGSDSWILRAYALVGSLLAVFVILLWVLALPTWVQASLGGSGTVTFSRAFLLLTGVLVVAPLLAPLLLAHRRRQNEGIDGGRNARSERRQDALYGLSGFLFVIGLYCSLLVSAPPELRDRPPAAIAPVVEFLYSLDPIYAIVPPVAAAAVILVVDRI